MEKFLKSFFYAANGIRKAVAEQWNIKVQLLAALIVIAAGLYFRITSLEWCAVLLTSAFVMALEIMNTAVENLVNLVTTERNPLAGKIKDLAAGSVLTAALVSVVIGWLVFGKYILEKWPL